MRDDIVGWKLSWQIANNNTKQNGQDHNNTAQVTTEQNYKRCPSLSF